MFVLCLRRAMLALLVFLCALPISSQTPDARLLVRHATLFTMAAGQRMPFLGYMVVEADGRIRSVGAGDPPAELKAAETWDAQGHWVIPGFLSAHSHLWQAAYRGLAPDSTLPGWLTALYGQAIGRTTAEDFYWFTLEGSLDHLRHGITGAYNFASSGGARGAGAGQGEQYNELQFKAEAESGIRFVHGFDAGGGSTPAAVEAARLRVRTFLEWSAKQPAAQGPNAQLLSVMLNGGAAFSANDSTAKLEGLLLREFPIRNQSHYLEPPDTQVKDREHWAWFVENGLVNDRMIFGHFVHPDAGIVAAAGKAHAAMSWNPLSNGRLASGVADVPAYLKAGMRVGMGVDGEASADLADPFENMRSGLYAIRDKYESATIMSPYDVLRLHTVGSADVLGVADKLGSLEPGKLADFLVIDPSHFAHIFDPYATLVFVTSQQDLERVYVGGKLMVERGRLLHHDLSKVEGEVDRRVAAEVGR